jgi:hypothetical protein
MVYSEDKKINSLYMPMIRAAKYLGDGKWLVSFSNGVVAICDYMARFGHIDEVKRLFNSEAVYRFRIDKKCRYSYDFVVKNEFNNMNAIVWDEEVTTVFLSCRELYGCALDYNKNKQLYDQILSMGNEKKTL